MKLVRLGRAALAFIVGVSLCACAHTQTSESTHASPTSFPSSSLQLATSAVPTRLPASTPSLTPSLKHTSTLDSNKTQKVATAHTPTLEVEASQEIAIMETPTTEIKELPTMEISATPTLEAQVEPLKITLVYDNNPFDLRLQTDWGFSALVEYRGHILLFDTGGNGSILLRNMEALEIDPASIQSIVLSHAHGDHTNGLEALLSHVENPPPVYFLDSFPSRDKYHIKRLTQVNEVMPGQAIAEGILTTGEIAGDPPEQSLIVRTAQGLVVITGCAHPGIIEIIERAKELTGAPVFLVLGGFHLGSKSEAEISAILADFRRLGVQKVAPCHCTGALALAMFAGEYGKDYLRVGVGSVIFLDDVGGIHVQANFSSSRWIETVRRDPAVGKHPCNRLPRQSCPLAGNGVPL